jgi:deoxyribonuclease IV
LFGSHLSISGGLHNALLEAQQLGMDCVQVFTANQRQWKPKPPTDEIIALWREHRRAMGDVPVVSHNSYLINLASPDAANREKSVSLFRSELERCENLDIPHAVTHPGSHVGAGEDEGLRRVARSLDRIHKDLPGVKVVTLLEVTAGQGTNLGASFEHLRRIIDLAADPDRLDVCLDTAHLIAAGYDLTSADGAKATLQQLDEAIGIDRVKCIHVNDSKHGVGSRKDRHEHIGHGHVSLEAFAVFCNEPAFRNVPKILETPKADAPDGRPWDTVNLETLRGLVRGA